MRKQLWSLLEVSILAAAIAFSVAAVAAADDAKCSARGWYHRPDQLPGSYQYVDPTKAGQTTQGAGAHTLLIWGGDGAIYELGDQCHEAQHCTGLTGTYKRPADAIAAAEWDRLYVTGGVLGGQALDANHYRIAKAGLWNEAIQVPTGAQTYTFFTLAELPPTVQHALAVANGCTNIPTPMPVTAAPTLTKRPGTPTARVTRTMGPCAPPAPCPVTSTPAPPATATKAPPTLTAAATAVPTSRPTQAPTAVPTVASPPTPAKPTGSGCGNGGGSTLALTVLGVAIYAKRRTA